MKSRILLGTLLLAIVAAHAQPRVENLVVVTLDGLRWQEIFRGSDRVLLREPAYNRDTAATLREFWVSTETERRKKLFPFIWTTVAAKGQIYGNRAWGNKVDNANPHWFSYPGYHEIFTGFPDSAINSNDKFYNPHVSVLEFLNRQPGYAGKVAAFATWDVFPFILNQPRSGLFVNADKDSFSFQTPEFRLLNAMQNLTTRPIGVRPDVFTYFAAREYLKTYKPRVLYIAFDETDDFAHAGMYDQYLGSARAQDGMIRDIWETLQSLPDYRDKTALLITVDHGRGDREKSEWKHHGKKISDSHEIWFAVMGPGISPLGEMRTTGQWYQAQLAATMASLLGFEFKPEHKVYPPVLFPVQ